MVHLKPEKGTAQQKALHLVPSVIKNPAMPIWMHPLTVIGMLIEMGAVEVARAVLVGGKMRGYPVQDHANTLLVQIVNEIHKIRRRPIAPRRGKVAGDLVAPGGVQRMLHDREEFDMGKSHRLDISGQFGSQLTIRQ